jgi:hypothetical protein
MLRIGAPGKPGKNYRAAVAVLLLALLPGAARSGEFYYVIFFASEGEVGLPRFAHTFATFVKANGSGPTADGYDVEAHTISWSPVSKEIRIARFFSEQGVNLDLYESLRWAGSLGVIVYRWGPFQIRKELYDRAVAQVARLKGGSVGYKTFDLGVRPASACNCVHALSDIDQDNGLLETGLHYGAEASYLVAHSLRRWMIEPEVTHEWVYDRLGLRDQPITPRTWGRTPAAW